MTPKTASGLWIANCVDCVEREFLCVGRIYSANLYHFPEFTGFLPACQHETKINFICVQYKLRAFHIRQPEFQSSTVPELQNPTSPELPKFPSISGTRPQNIKVTSAGPPDTYNKYNPRRKKKTTLSKLMWNVVFFFFISAPTRLVVEVCAKRVYLIIPNLKSVDLYVGSMLKYSDDEFMGVKPLEVKW